jgi:predicted nuclease with TOPRIM domain
LPNTKSSVIEYSLEDNTAPESEDESRMSRLDDFNVDMERNRRLAMYELDDMKRINRSLREDLEAVTAEKHALAKQLEEKCDEFNELNDDVDKFAEAFAAQESELEKLQFENKMLKASASKR